jgi:hypothetical protein
MPGRTQNKDQKSRTCPAKSGRLVTLFIAAFFRTSELTHMEGVGGEGISGPNNIARKAHVRAASEVLVLKE